jgi:hypothetical protein
MLGRLLVEERRLRAQRGDARAQLPAAPVGLVQHP